MYSLSVKWGLWEKSPIITCQKETTITDILVTEELSSLPVWQTSMTRVESLGIFCPIQANISLQTPCCFQVSTTSFQWQKCKITKQKLPVKNTNHPYSRAFSIKIKEESWLNRVSNPPTSGLNNSLHLKSFHTQEYVGKP